MIDAGEPQVLEGEYTEPGVQLIVGGLRVEFPPVHAVQKGPKLGFRHADGGAGRVDGRRLDSIIIRFLLMNRPVSV